MQVGAFVQRDRSPLLFTSAAVFTLGGLIIITLLPNDITLYLAQYFPDGPFRWALWGVLVTFVLSLMLEGVAAFLGQDRFAPLAPLASAGSTIHATLEEVRSRLEVRIGHKEPDISGALDELLEGALTLQGSDIHLNPLSTGLKVDYRINGVLYPVATLPGALVPRFSQRVKVLAHLDAYAKTPQDGVLRRALHAGAVEARVSVLPANHGERVVLRLVRGEEGVRGLEDLGIDGALRSSLMSILDKPQGLLFVSGPVGSGKTTTLYSSLRYIHDSRGETTSIMTLEDPIEHQLTFCTQTQINSKVGMTFAQTLRSVLRQDPGALMVGEIRDRETAQIATQAGLTGHLILTTVHVDSAAGTFTRLMEMEVEPYVLSSATVGALAQRLVRGLCEHCKIAKEPTSEERTRFSQLGTPISGGTFFAPVGCSKCEGRGFDRRIPIAELLLMTDSVKEAVRAGRATEDIHRLSVQNGMVPLVAHGLLVASQGQTSLAEVLRVTG